MSSSNQQDQQQQSDAYLMKSDNCPIQPAEAELLRFVSLRVHCYPRSGPTAEETEAQKFPFWYPPKRWLLAVRPSLTRSSLSRFREERKRPPSAALLLLQRRIVLRSPLIDDKQGKRGGRSRNPVHKEENPVEREQLSRPPEWKQVRCQKREDEKNEEGRGRAGKCAQLHERQRDETCPRWQFHA